MLDAETLVRQSIDLLASGRRARAAWRLAQALLAICVQWPQRLPSWVVPGVEVEWVGEGPRDVYVVVEVHRDKPWRFVGEKIANGAGAPREPCPAGLHPSWYFVGERIASGSLTRATFSQERGRRHWRRYRGKTSTSSEGSS